MKTISKILTVSAVAVAALTTAAGTAQAQNTNYTDGDLVLFFQKTGGSGSDQQVFASLGNTATVFRAAFTAQSDLTSIVNINATLNSAFGSGWANATTLYGGAGGVWSDGSQGSALQNGDPSRTVYTTLARPSIGVVGSANSDGFSTVNSGGSSFISTAIIQQNNIFETQERSIVWLNRAKIAQKLAKNDHEWHEFFDLANKCLCLGWYF
jgi:hypothetical protein